MITNELLVYIQAQLDADIAKNAIIKNLRKAGWEQAVVDEAFGRIAGTRLVAAKQTIAQTPVEAESWPDGLGGSTTVNPNDSSATLTHTDPLAVGQTAGASRPTATTGLESVSGGRTTTDRAMHAIGKIILVVAGLLLLGALILWFLVRVGGRPDIDTTNLPTTQQQAGAQADTTATDNAAVQVVREIQSVMPASLPLSGNLLLQHQDWSYDASVGSAQLLLPDGNGLVYRAVTANLDARDEWAAEEVVLENVAQYSRDVIGGIERLTLTATDGALTIDRALLANS